MEDAHPNIERMTQLLDRLGLILNKILDENAPINNRRVLFQALHSLSRSPSCDRNVKRRVDTLLPLLDDILDTNVVLVTHGLNQWDGTTNFVNLPIWQQIPTVISGFMEDAHPNIERMTQLLDRLGLILNKILDENAPINNRRVLFQALHSLSRSPSCDRNVKRRVDTLLPLLDDILDTNVVLLSHSPDRGQVRRDQLLQHHSTPVWSELLRKTAQRKGKAMKVNTDEKSRYSVE
ncbi:hypothetical protein BLNAU_11411 [Blattamonas nauphoetae]|uniref:Uncharacterized protein n=1 Tax=Blattamonas nauphoetae TaxID=2049346 RepID=A0ABQ9XQD9_9EUKA|nr:hypothetical protein BLNAU_11411 [Blattamonas nauphoetae]